MSEMKWLESWGLPVDGRAAGFERQLNREISLQHLLFGQPVCLLVPRCGRDDVLFGHPNGSVA